MTRVDAIDALLPQTQCTRCGYEGCRPYAQALDAGDVDLNRCPPGGDATIAGLAELLGMGVKALDASCGTYQPSQVAWVDAENCIGCAKCLAPCPVDAIVGAPKFLHAVLSDVCTGCELCVAPCPVDCIHMIPADRGHENDAAANKHRHLAHVARLATRSAERSYELAEQKETVRAL